MADKNLVVKVSADISGFKKGMEAAAKETKDLEEELSRAAKLSAVAFTALVGVIGGSIAAFRGQEVAVNQLEQAIKNQGLEVDVLSSKYQAQATALQKLTTFGDEEIIAAQAILQAQVGQQEVTEALTTATLDLAAAKGIDLASAAELVGKTIGTNTNALARNGVEINNNLRGTERLNAVVAAIAGQFDKQSQVVAKGSGSFLQLKNALSDVAETLGQELVPLLEPTVRYLTNLVATFAANREAAAFAAKVLLVGTGITALATAVPLLGVALLKLRAVMAAVGGMTAVLATGFKALVGATGIGLLLVAVTDLALNWETRTKQMSALFTAFAENVKALAFGIATIFAGVFSFDVAQVREGLAAVETALSESVDRYKAIREEQIAADAALQAKADEEKLAADAATEEERRKRYEERRAANQAQDIADIKTEAQIKADLQKENDAAELQAKVEFEYAKKNVATTVAQEETAMLRQEQLTRLQDEQRYGKELAAVRAVFRSKEFAATSETFSALSTLTASKNKDLFRIGKAAAIANAIVNTAQGVTRALSAYPPPFSFIAAAAQATAGAVQIGTIKAQGMAKGGPVVGGMPGKDSVPAMLMPGEIVAPKKNFDEVVNAVANQRARGGNTAGDVTVRIELAEGLMDFIEAQIIERRRLGVSLV